MGRVIRMQDVNGRRFLQVAGGSVATTLFSDSIARALSIPANRATRSIRDIEHIVVLMQENRSFDHYFGTLRGVRGFGDPHPVTLPSGQPVWFQANGSTVIPPFRPVVGNLALTFIEDLDHSWGGTHEMFNGGNWDPWLPSKTTTTMAHLERKDLPFHSALADAFTVCDANHCSMLGPTDPNRYYMWTGWDGKGGGPVNAAANSPLAQRARTGTDIEGAAEITGASQLFSTLEADSGAATCPRCRGSSSAVTSPRRSTSRTPRTGFRRCPASMPSSRRASCPRTSTRRPRPADRSRARSRACAPRGGSATAWRSTSRPTHRACD
jgi:hypothetical protein